MCGPNPAVVQERAEDEVVAELAGAEIGFDLAGGVGTRYFLAEAGLEALIELLAAGEEVVELGLVCKDAQGVDEAREVFLAAKGAIDVRGEWLGLVLVRVDRIGRAWRLDRHRTTPCPSSGCEKGPRPAGEDSARSGRRDRPRTPPDRASDSDTG